MAPDSEPGWEFVDTDLLPGWAVRIELGTQDGSPIVSALRIAPTATTPEGGLSTRDLRKVLLGELLRRGAGSLGMIQREFAPEGWLERQGFESLTPASGRPGRRGNPIEHYLQVADVYARAVNAGINPTAAVMEAIPGFEQSTVVQWIYDARRKHGLLEPPPRRGVAGGGLTDKAKQLLAKQGEN